MKLSSLHSRTNKNDIRVLKEYLEKLKQLQIDPKSILKESKITITIDDDKDPVISTEAKTQFVERAKSIGQFDNAEWVNQIINGMKQVGVQGFNKITEDEKPVTQKEMKQLVGLLVNLLNSN